MENARAGKDTAEDLFSQFMDSQDCPDITHSFRRLVQVLGIKNDNPREFYSLLKGKLQSWRCKSLWELLDLRANQKEYGKGKLCEDTQVLVIGAGPIGLRTAIEVALLGAQVVIVEKRESFARNNVLHLWPFLLTDFRSLGAKKFYGKFCSGSIDHISIRKLQAILLKAALIFGAKLHTGVTFEHLVEPNSPEDCWKCKVSPKSHPVSEYEFDVLIGADGKKNVIPGFQQIEMRGTLAIGITANFVNHGTEAEANVEEISGIAYQFNPQFFDDLYEQKGIKLENIVYYKDETHYFVMTAGKASLLKRGALKQDLCPSWKLLAPDNIDHSKLLEYVTDVVKYATKGTLKNLELKLLANKQPDIAAFDFTSIKKAEHAARIVERKASKLLVGLVGDSLLEPFWPTGSGCARGVLSALDAAWMIRSFAQDKPPLQILSERENIYRLLSGTNAENLHKNHATYTINPNTRYLHITHKKIREVYHLYDTDDPVNADFSLGSPQTDFANKASRKRRVSTGAKSTAVKGYRRGRADSQLAADFGRIRSTSGSSVENALSRKPLSATNSEPLDGRNRSQALNSTGSDDEVFKTKGKRVKVKSKGSPLTGRRGRSSTVGSSGDELKDKRKRRTVRKRTFSRESVESPKEKTHRKRGFFGFGKAKQKRKSEEGRTNQSDKGTKSMKSKRQGSVENLEHNPQNGVTLSAVHKKGENHLRIGEKRDPVRSEDFWNKQDPVGTFSRDQYTRRSAREIIREMEARSRGKSLENAASLGEESLKNLKTKNTENPHERDRRETKDEEEKNRKNKENKRLGDKKMIKKEDEKMKIKNKEKKKKEEDKRKKEGEKKRQEQEKAKKEEEEKRKKNEEEEKKKEQNQHLQNKRGTQVKSSDTPPNKRTKKQGLLEEIAEISPSVKRAIPVLSKLTPGSNKETKGGVESYVTSAVRDAAMVLLATPLLIDSLSSTVGKNRAESMLLRDSGRVRDVVNRYNTLSDMTPLVKMNGCVTPLRRPRDRVDGPEEKPRRLDKICNESEGNDGSEKDARNTTADISNSPAEQRKGLVLRRSCHELVTSPSLQRLMSKLQDLNGGTPQVDENVAPKIDQVTTVAVSMESNESKDEKQDRSVESSSKNEEGTPDVEEVIDECLISREKPVIKDFTSPIWQKTAIAVVTEKSQENKENEADTLNSSVKKDKDKQKKFPKLINSQNRRRLSASPCEIMSKKLQNLLDNTTPSRAMESIKYMIGVCKQIQKHPNEEKYYRIFKGRVKFRKHVGTIRNAKLFMVSSGWTEIGSFFVFPLSKRIEEPLLILNKYLSIAEEEGNKGNATRTGQRAKLQRAGSSDLAERILELKDALVSARIKNKVRKSISEGTSENRPSLLFKRTISLDEMSILRRKNASNNTTGSDSKKENGHGKVDSAPRKDTEDERGNLSRSLSENALNNSPDICAVSSPNFSPFKRTFSQRSTQDDGDWDLVMENPLGVVAAADEEKLDQASTSDAEESDRLKTSPTTGEGPTRHVLSPRDAVVEEADQLSSVLGNLIESLGSFDNTDDDEQSGAQKAERQTAQGDKLDGETAIQRHKNKDFEELCETLSFLITEGSSDSSENANDLGGINDTGNTLSEKEPNVDQELRSRNGAFKVPLPSTRKGAEQLKKAKNTDGTTTSLRRSRTNNRERRPKASSIDVPTVHNRSKIGQDKERVIGLRKSTSNGNRRNSPGQRVGSTSRSQRQMADRSQALETSGVPQRKLVNTNKRDSGKEVNGRQMKRVASKANSVDLDRTKERPLTSRSKSVDLAKKSEQGGRVQSCRRSQNNRRSATSSSSEEDAKKKQATKNSKGTTRTQATNLRSYRERVRLSPPKGNFKSRPGELTAVKKREKADISNSETEKQSSNSSTVVNRTRGENVPDENRGENNGGAVCRLEFHGFTESEEIIMPEKNSSDNDSGIHTKEEEVSDHIATDNDPTKNVSKPVEEMYDVETAKTAQHKETVLADVGLNARVTVENRKETVELSQEIQSFYNTKSVERDQEESDLPDTMKEKHWPPNDFERRELVQEAEKSAAQKKEESEEEVDGFRPKTVSRDQEEQSSSVSIQSATLELVHPRESNKKMLSDIGRQHSRGGSRRETVPLTLEERKQLILEASLVKPTSKPTDKRRSILQIKRRNDGKLVKNAKVAFEEKSPAKQLTAETTDAGSSKQHHFRFRGRKKKSFESANVPLEVVTEAQEETRDEEPITNGHVESDQSHNEPFGNEVSLAQVEARSLEQDDERALKKKQRSPVRLSPFRLPFTKRTGSYDLGSSPAETIQESPEHFTSKFE